MDENIITIRNVNLNVNNIPILTGINLTIQRGSIFGLIGPSGCGKTTLIRAILGLLPYQSGNILVDSDEPSQVTKRQAIGYMPQDLALPPILTVREMIEFCGKVYQMKKKDLDGMRNRLFKIFTITQSETFIGLLNAGQKRRVSLCCALIHRPSLVILDEPTVGSDPIIRQNIWQYLERRSKKYGMTVILTTHYFEEAMSTDKIGFIREGRLIKAGKPSKLLDYYQVDTLEEAMVHICHEDDLAKHQLTVSIETSNSDLSDYFKSPNETRNRPSTPNRTSSVNLMGAIFWRITRRLSAIVSVLIFSCLLNFGTMYIMTQFFIQPPKHMPICILSRENRIDLVENLIHQFNPDTITATMCQDHDTAWTQVKNRSLTGFIEIPPQYLTQIDTILENRNDPNVGFSDLIDTPLIKFHGDYGNRIIGELLQTFIQLGIFGYFRDRFSAHNINPDLVNFVKMQPVYGSLELFDSKDTIMVFLPIVILWMVNGYSQSQVVFGLEFENINQFAERQFSMGIKPWHLILAHVICGLAIQLPIFLAFYYGFLSLLGIPVLTSFNVLLTFFMTLVSLSGMSISLLLFSITGSMFGAGVILAGYMMSGFWVSGVVTPLEAIPYWVTPIRYLFPFHLVDHLVKDFVKGKTLTALEIIFNSSLLFIFYIVLPLILVTVLRQRKHLKI